MIGLYSGGRRKVAQDGAAECVWRDAWTKRASATDY
jgi:hypothetical protein